MCGIAGWTDFNNNIHEQREDIQLMCDTLQGRGPDAFGYSFSKHVVLGHRRLVVIDPTRGTQPMRKEGNGSAYTLVYNGELYNTHSIRLELKRLGYEFFSHSDTEVLLTAYIAWGEACVDKLNGIFAFAIYDEKDDSIFLVRDRFGVKPLFYSILGRGEIIFSSDIRSILCHSKVKNEVKMEQLLELLYLGPARAPGSGIINNVNELEPGTFMVFKKDSSKLKTYWKLDSHPHEHSLNSTIERVRFYVTDSIRRQLVSDVPLGTFLSGGVDSSIITAVAADHYSKVMNSQLHTYSIDYENNDKFFKKSNFQPDTDTEYIKAVSDKYNTIHHQIILNTEDVFNALYDAVIANGLPGMADIDSSLLLFCNKVKEHMTVALSGECADEIFGGYPWYHREELMNANTFPWTSKLANRLTFINKEIIYNYNPKEFIGNFYNETLKRVPKLAGETKIEIRRRELFYLNFYWFMSTLLTRKDRMSMYSGLEVRVPFCDHRLVQYTWNIPWEIKNLDNIEKGLLREATKNLLPNKVLKRKKNPYPKTHNPLYEKMVSERLLERINSFDCKITDIIDKDFIEKSISQKSDIGNPWFGQLMAEPQMYAYLIQLDYWLDAFKIRIV